MPRFWELLVLDGCWALFCLVWLVGLVYNVRHAPPVVRRGGFQPSLLVGAAVVLLLFVLRHVVPGVVWDGISYRALWLELLGAAVLVGSTCFTFWARWRLGIMWTSAAVVKADHELRTDGPYRITRHPIYTGMLGMLVGTAMVGGLGVWLLVVVIGVVIAEVKLRAEEKLLLDAFPQEYAEFRHRVPRLAPLPRPRHRPMGNQGS